MTTYGILSDAHRAPLSNIFEALDRLKAAGASKLILNGDIDGDRQARLLPQEYLLHLLEEAADTGMEVYAIPGSHETVERFHPVLQHVASKRLNVIDLFRNPKIDAGDHHLVFLPGSDWRAGPAIECGYALDTRYATGLYKTKSGQVLVTNMEDLRKHVTDPEKTVVICHVPRKFDTDTAVDMAHFAQHHNGTSIPAGRLTRMLEERFGKFSPHELRAVALAYGYELRSENRGNEDLAMIYDELGITKAISGHFHGSVHRAHDRGGRHVPQGAASRELFWMASHVDARKAGLLTVHGTHVTYQNVEF